MKRGEFIVIGVTIFFLMNTYYDNYYIQYLKSFKKYWTMTTIAFSGFSLFLLLRNKPKQTSSLIQSLASITSVMPINNKIKKQYIEPLSKTFEQNNNYINKIPEQKTIKRSVSESKKKFVASQQKWLCKRCGETLNASYEVDHRIPLYKGGTNDISNLEALCRNCHGQKTLMDKL